MAPAGRNVAGESARDAAERRQGYTEFAIVKLFGPAGNGTEAVVVEASLVAVAGAERRIVLREMQDKIVSSQEAFSVSRRELHFDATGDFVTYRYQPGPQRNVHIVLDGREIRVLNQDPLSRGHQHSIPAELDEPRILEEDFVAPYQWLFQELLANSAGAAAPGARHPLDGRRIAAIVSHDLQMRDFLLEVEATETLKTPSREVLASRVLVTSTRRGVPALERRFWIDAAGVIIRMEEPRQDRHHRQNYRAAFNRAYYPDAGGTFTEPIDIAAPGGGERRGLLTSCSARVRVDAAYEPPRGPAILLLTPAGERTPTRSRFVHRTRWGLARRGFPVLSVETGAEGEDEFRTLEQMLDAVRSHPAVDGKQVVLLAHEGTLALALRVLERFELARLIAVEAHMPEALWDDAKLRALFAPEARRLLWVTRGAEGGGAAEAHARTAERITRALPPGRMTVQVVPGVDSAYWPAAPEAARDGDFPETLAPLFFSAVRAFVLQSEIAK